MCARVCTIATLVALVTLGAPLAAQDDGTAGLFTKAGQLPLVAQSMSLRLEGGDAVVELVQVFANDGDGLAQADYRLHLPSDATVDGFGFWRDGRFLAATLQEREEAVRAHRTAAETGHATGLMQREGAVHSFSVFPIGAHAQQQVAVTLRLPVVTERGRSHVHLPLDDLLAGAPLSSTIFALLRTAQPLSAFGVDGASFQLVGRGRQWARLALSSEQPVDIWWSEDGPPLVTTVAAVPLEDGSLALELRLGLNDASAWRAAPRPVVLLVDGSFSMRRRRAALVELVRRLGEVAPGRLRLVQVGERTAEVTPGDPAALARGLLAADVGLHATWDDLVRAALAAGCAERDGTALRGAPEAGPRCLVVTDPQVEGLPPAAERRVETLFLADADELAYFGGQLGQGIASYQPGVEPRAKLFAFADALALPVLELTSLEQPGGTLEPVGARLGAVAEGGMERLFARTRSTAPLAVALAVDGHPLSRELPVEVLDVEGEAGRALRRAFHVTLLADWMAEFRRGADPELRKKIVDTSLREGIPTELTGLQVDDATGALAGTATPGPLLRLLGSTLLGLGLALAWLVRRHQ